MFKALFIAEGKVQAPDGQMCKIGRHKDMKCQGNRWEHRPAGKPNCKETDGTKKGGIPKLRGCCCTDEDAVPDKGRAAY